jgi:hypothetical protein
LEGVDKIYKIGNKMNKMGIIKNIAKTFQFSSTNLYDIFSQYNMGSNRRHVRYKAFPSGG